MPWQVSREGVKGTDIRATLDRNKVSFFLVRIIR